MTFLQKMFGKKLLSYIILSLIGITFIFIPIEDLSARDLGIFLLVIAVLGIIYEAKLRYYIKFKHSLKEFKSNKEKFIAEYFDKKKIKYLYEKELKVESETLHPDFYLPEFDVYVEYWGKWDTDFEYRKECNHKRKLYVKEEIPLIELYPDNLTSINQLDWKFTERLLNLLKKDRS